MKTQNKILIVTRIIKGKDHIFQKIIAQAEAFTNIGFEVDIIYVNENYDLFFNEKAIVNLRSRIGIQFLFFKYINNRVNLGKYAWVYLRNPFLINQISYIKFLHRMKSNGAKIILEIPTYPYKDELKGILQKSIYYAEISFSFLLKKYLTKVLYSGNRKDFIYGVEAVQLANVGDTKKMPLSLNEFSNERIVLISVSGCMIYHGNDRIIEGLNNYYKKNNNVDVEFYIVGDGPYLNEYKQLVDKYKLKHVVHFFGSLYGEEADEVFNKANIGISCVGMHRIGLREGSPLKTAEYGVRGLPIVLGYEDLSFSNCNFCYNIDQSDKPIDIDKLVSWFISNKFEKKEIRKYVYDNVTWEKQFEKILGIS